MKATMNKDLDVLARMIGFSQAEQEPHLPVAPLTYDWMVEKHRRVAA